MYLSKMNFSSNLHGIIGKCKYKIKSRTIQNYNTKKVVLQKLLVFRVEYCLKKQVEIKRLKDSEKPHKYC